MDLYYNGDKIQDIVYNEADGLNFEEIGYTGAPDNIQKGFDYAKEIKEGWDSSVSSLYSRFKEDTSLVFMPMVDISSVTNMNYCFSGCTNLIEIPELNTISITDMNYCFANCSSLTTIPQLNTSNVTNMRECFYNCSKLIEIPELDTGKVTVMESCFYNCDSLTTIPQLDTSNVIRVYNCFGHCDKLKRIPSISFKSMGSISSYSDFIFGYFANSACRYILIKDIGTNPNCTTIDTTYTRVWGIADTEITDAKQSLIDSLLTYSFDRRAAGYSDCTIKLYSDVKAVLTSDEITQIQNKGYIIS